ncbi:acetyltransferase [Blastomyces dermatitidis ER-3]|uniref:Acetyltransferase n=2 Tax=Blastomyces TaxID=229219 RepID=A0A179UZS7_BLAGS|nr:acetyltransferase [Blastomyces gilchristii SLH14081]XP_045273323.1 acetyltransferase [Blastomyces dermatitidis ER-3]EEQ85612.1 acetyltransferase [Blastomyces dermatitidis ER-3]EQL34471.1 acetyltransferase [Blastomyces dermatitidis ATCC 26199]OAT11852.1 acetyltransferase [Blastomyces gilchristii SLH14081]
MDPPPLSTKDQSLFRQVVRLCESKQYKKGIKAADQVLRRNPKHGETQAMKALILSNQGQQEEAFALARLAITNHFKSHICWHVYGLLYRADKNYDEAIKAYKTALKFDPESQAIQRDLALLQAQMRDYQGYVQSRTTMLQQKPGFRQNWTALAIAHHLAGNLTEAENVLTTYEQTLKTPPPRTDMDHSEAVLYKNSIIAESGNLERALEHLDEVGKGCFDVLAVMEMRADYLLRLGRKEEAAAAYEALLERNSENSNYYEALIKAKDIDKSDHKTLKAIFDEWAEKNPRGDAARRIPLDFLEGQDFRDAADNYLQRMLRRGIPSTFANIKFLYTNSAKRDIIQELVEGYASGQLGSQMNGSAENQTKGDASVFESSVYYFLAQHYNYHLSRNLEKAVEYIEKAITLSPKSVDYHMTKARIWKHFGNIPKAVEFMEIARSLDEKDRYINSKAAKYQLRNDENEKALDNMSKFTRNETVGGTLGDLHEMQCVWYLTEDGESYLRQRKLGLALKRFHAVHNIFDVWYEDQFDFHSFSLRKGMIRAYVDMIRWEDHLRDHPYYTRSALAAVKAYLLLHDQPDLVHGPIPRGMNGNQTGEVDSAERKKALKKAKREQLRMEKAEAEKRDLKKASSTKGGDRETKKEDPDPLGTKLVRTTEPLKDSMKFLTPLLEFSPRNIEVQTAGFEVYIRRNKFLLSLKCLLAAHSIDPQNPTLHIQLARFRKTIDTLSEPLPSRVSEVITADFDPLLPKTQDLTSWNESFLSAHKSSAAHVQAALSVRQLLNPDSKSQGEQELLSTVDLETTSLEVALAGLHLLDDWHSSQDAKSAYISQAQKKWVEASIFQPQHVL